MNKFLPDFFSLHFQSFFDVCRLISDTRKGMKNLSYITPNYIQKQLIIVSVLACLYSLYNFPYIVQLNPAKTGVKGETNSICYWWISFMANVTIELYDWPKLEKIALI